jgi:hypothetical protein
MKKTIISIIILILLSFIATAYQFLDDSDLNNWMDFTSGGIQNQSNAQTGYGYNVSAVVGGSMLPFNDTGVSYSIYQGTLYIVWSNIGISLESFGLNCSVKHREIEWGEINCTTNQTVTWRFSIVDNSTNESYHVFDNRTDGIRKFLGLKPSRTYRIDVNATLGDSTETQSIKLKTKTGAENLEIAIILGLSVFAIIFIIIGIILFLRSQV